MNLNENNNKMDKERPCSCRIQRIQNVQTMKKNFGIKMYNLWLEEQGHRLRLLREIRGQ